MKRNATLIGFVLVFAVLLLAMIPLKESKKIYHSVEEMEYFQSLHTQMTGIDSSVIFPTATNCNGCHGYDTRRSALVDYEGQDVNMSDDWSPTMMANSAKDPFWRAKVSHEILTNPQHSLDLQTKCTSCHAPQGHFTAILRGASHYTIDEMLADTTAMDGVSCGTCHKISEENLGKQFSGELSFDTTRVSFGPYELPFASPMNDFVGIEPVYSEHINDAGICASCHTLITNSVDLAGDYTGEQFVEQATYHEWLNSDFADDGLTPITCQGCHIPRIEEEVVISANYLFLEGRTPYGIHDLVGGNTTMLQLMKENKESLGIKAADEHFDETIEKTFKMLQKQTLDTELTYENLNADTAFFTLRLKNKAGHKFPSGYPSRRAYVEFVLTSETGDTLFQSGVMDEDYEVAGQTAETEPHFQIINQEDQVQIYELVLGDVDGNFTTVLERSHQALKDNRLPPAGFTNIHSAYDTTRIYGNALLDTDFNIENGVEGSGCDLIHYQIPLNAFEGFAKVSAKVYYQSLPPKWMAPLFEENSPEIDTFRRMYDQADLSPVLIAEEIIDSLNFTSTGINELLDQQIIVFPNPVAGDVINISSHSISISGIILYDIQGRELSRYGQNITTIDLPKHGNIFLLKINTEKGAILKRIIKR